MKEMRRYRRLGLGVIALCLSLIVIAAALTGPGGSAQGTMNQGDSMGFQPVSGNGPGQGTGSPSHYDEQDPGKNGQSQSGPGSGIGPGRNQTDTSQGSQMWEGGNSTGSGMHPGHGPGRGNITGSAPDMGMNPGQGNMTRPENGGWQEQQWGNSTTGSGDHAWGPGNSTGLRPGPGFGPDAGNMTSPGLAQDTGTRPGNWSAFDPSQENATGQGYDPARVPVEDNGKQSTDSIIASFLNLFGLHSR